MEQNTLDIPIEITSDQGYPPVNLTLREVTDRKVGNGTAKFTPSFVSPDVLSGVVEQLKEKGLDESVARNKIFADMTHTYGYE